ncbi:MULTISPECIES: general secretion pathway protein GspB [unclassified Roseateles]|uniref:general secretion pathway protein GspB n=1 Tax=unclassified Roseateles TaxID=2626991 RepID=UPI0006FE2062|nr:MULTISPECIES: general secretion pathway protein GspB [unclassified Roseateles]KQW43260.1 hypothetical protein ASC81_15785 [Pelomonas sp. Root405]KRA70998.1 hypothetical protein ASD88_14310 [Pelomonas sp. Root662]
MSYILDALRRAEADRERERGQVPGLHTQATAGSETAPAAGQRRWLPWAGAGLLLLAGIGAGSWWASGPQPAPPPVAQPAPPPAPVADVGTPPDPSVPVPQPEAASSPYLPPAPPPVAVAPAPAPTPATVTAPAPAAAGEARIPRLAELPESTRRELPNLAISGSVYSDDPASRFVMVNGEVVREGAKLGADLVLEQIRPRELVLSFKGQRYRLPV